jgi:hypothetical protein
MARRNEELNELEQDIARRRRDIAETWRALRGGKARPSAELAHAGAKPAQPRRSAAGIAVGALVAFALVVPRIVGRMQAGQPVGEARDRLG